MIYITEKRSELNIIVPELASQAAELEPVTSNESKKHIINQTLSSVSLILHTFAPNRTFPRRTVTGLKKPRNNRLEQRWEV